MTTQTPAVTLKLFRAAMEHRAQKGNADVSTANIEDVGPYYEWTMTYPDGCSETAHFIKAVGYIVCTVRTPCDDVYTTHGTLEQFKTDKSTSI